MAGINDIKIANAMRAAGVGDSDTMRKYDGGSGYAHNPQSNTEAERQKLIEKYDRQQNTSADEAWKQYKAQQVEEAKQAAQYARFKAANDAKPEAPQGLGSLFNSYIKRSYGIN